MKDYELYEAREMLKNVLIWIYERFLEETIENIFIECFGIDDAEYLREIHSKIALEHFAMSGGEV